MFSVTGLMVSMGRAMHRISQVPPESTRHGAEASTLRLLSIFLAEEKTDMDLTSQWRRPLVGRTVVGPAVQKRFPKREMGILRPLKHLLVSGIQFLEFLGVSSQVRMIDLGQSFVGRSYLRHVAFGKELLSREFEQPEAFSLEPAQPGLEFLVRSDGFGIDLFLVVLLEKDQGG